MMKVVYTHDIFSSQPHGGISRYFVELVSRMPRNGAKFEILAGLHINRYLGSRRLEVARIVGLAVPPVPHTRFLRHFANAALQRLLLDSGPNTVVHQTYCFRSPRITGAKLVLTVHDMIHELFPGDFPEGDPTSRLKREYCERADHVIAVSESTKSDLIRCFGIDAGKISVIPHGVPLFCAEASEKTVTAAAAPFLLYVGTRGGYKNFERLARAYASSERLKGSFRLICFGGRRFTAEERRLLDELNVASLVTQVDGDDRELAAHYSKARALVYPSRYEGFGFPPLEAMSLGCPVICSDASSLPEVVGDAGVYFDSRDVDAMRSTLEAALFDDALLAGRIQAGRDRAAQFSWDVAAAKTLEVYRSCASSL